MNAELPDDAAKRVVIDANALIALIAREPESDAVTVHFAGWISDGVELHAPELARYEIANALTRKVSHDEVQADDLPAVWAELDALPIVYHPLTDGVDTISLAIDWNGAARSTPLMSLSLAGSTLSCGRWTGARTQCR